jgi:hypothetical protein
VIKDLTTSDISRQNILNNNFALEKVELYLALGGITWKNERVFTKAQLSNLLQIDERTIDRHIENHKDEITQNGYTILKGLELKKYVGDIHVVDISRAPSLGVFTFKTVLNKAFLKSASFVNIMFCFRYFRFYKGCNLHNNS